MWKKYRLTFEQFMYQIENFTKELDISLDKYLIDHAAIRLKNIKDVIELHNDLDNIATKISEATVNGRKICNFKLNNPLHYKNWSVQCLESPYPASDHNYPKDGWEHVEVVLPNTTPEKLEQQFFELFPNLSKNRLRRYNYSISTPSVKGEKLVNTSISVEKEKGLAIKFHSYSIEEIVKSQQI